MGEGIRLRRFACRAALLCLLCLHKEEEEEKRRNQNHLTPLSRPHTHTLDIYYLAPSSCEQLLAVAFVHPLPPPASAPAPASPPARARVTMAARQFYRKLCKDLPTIMEMYKLDELTSIGTLRNTLKELFYQNKKYTDPNMINVMVHKANEELQLILRMHKQRHHVITKYVVMHDPFKSKVPPSGFLAQFYASN